MSLLIEPTHFFQRCFVYLLCCPQGLRCWAKDIVLSNKYVDRYFINCVDRHFSGLSLPIFAFLHVVRSILLEPALYTILEHMLKLLHRRSLIVVIVRHAVLHADLMADQASHFTLPTWIQRTVDHTICSGLEYILVALKDLLLVHHFRNGARSHQNGLIDMMLEEFLFVMSQSIEHLC